MNQRPKRSAMKIFAGVSAGLALGLLAAVGGSWMSQAAEECCKAGDTTPPVDLVKQVPPGGLHSPYQDYAKLAKDDRISSKSSGCPDVTSVTAAAAVAACARL